MAGAVLHSVLEQHLRDPGKAIAELVRQALARELGDVVPGPDAMRARRAVLSTLDEFDAREQAFRATYRLTPQQFEQSFSPANPPALVIPSETGDVALAGKIDRIDVAPGGEQLIIDYKYSRGLKAPTLEADGQDTSLQLAVYLLYARDCAAARVIGAELYSLKEWKRVGILRKAFVPAAVPESRNAVLVDDEEMDAFLAGWREWIVRAVADILAGRIDTVPRDLDKCGFAACEMCDVCRFRKWMVENA